MSDHKFSEPTRFTRFLDFLWGSAVWFVLAAISLYKDEMYQAFGFFAFGLFTVLVYMVTEVRDTLIQTRKEIAELKELIKTK
jgi:hypothetical protein